MKPQKALQTSLTATLISVFMLAPLNSSEMVTKIQPGSFSNHLGMVAAGSSKESNHREMNGRENSKKMLNQEKSENIKTDKKHSEEDKHNNHVYNYDWINSRKKWQANLIRHLVRIFVVISFISVLLCGYMSIIH